VFQLQHSYARPLPLENQAAVQLPEGARVSAVGEGKIKRLAEQAAAAAVLLDPAIARIRRARSDTGHRPVARAVALGLTVPVITSL
jgi:hypothetical protein